MKANELNKAAEEYAYTNWESDDYHDGASEGMPFDPIGHTEKCFKAGAEWQRERMLEGAIERTVSVEDWGHLVVKVDGLGFSYGNKVKLIIIKES